MNQKIIFLLLIITVTFFACKQKEIRVEVTPLKNLEVVDDLLSQIVEKRQYLSTSSSEKTIVIGKKGTIIYINPEEIETIDGSSLGNTIVIELLEMTDKRSLILNNAPTVSNGEILVTGGAYYLGMTSDGKPLRLKKGKGLEVEFPKLSDDEMRLFLGERDSLGQINWVQTPEKLSAKAHIPFGFIRIDTSINHEPTYRIDTIFSDEFEQWTADTLLLPPKIIDPSKVTEKEYKDYLKNKAAYEKQMKEIANIQKTYDIVKLMNLGWINCDRFLKDTKPKIDINLWVKNDSLVSARFYAVFKDINSVISTRFLANKETATFHNIPKGKELYIIGISINDKTFHFFEKSINTEYDKEIHVDFVPSSQKEIEERLLQLN